MEVQLELKERVLIAPKQAGRPVVTPDEFANTLTHGFGFLLSVVGTVVLLSAASEAASWIAVGCAIYSATLVAVYAASTMSHLVMEPQRKRTWRTIDQAAIYLLCAGSYTPFALAYACGEGYWWILVAMWITAVAGFATKMLLQLQIDGVCLPIYIVLGWMPIIAAQPSIENAPFGALVLAIAGGACYSAGIWFLANDNRHIYYHAVWHLLVISGSLCHFLVMLCYVVGTPG